MLHIMTSAELIKALKAAGWQLRNVKGSHHVFSHPDRPLNISVPHPRKDLGVGLVQQIRRKAGI